MRTLGMRDILRLLPLHEVMFFLPSGVKLYKQRPCSDSKLAKATRDSYSHVEGLARRCIAC
jgi:hypothetical protein